MRTLFRNAMLHNLVRQDPMLAHAVRPIAMSLLCACLLPACAGIGHGVDAPPIPANAVETTRTESNGDVISEYRVQGQLRMVRVQPARGPVFYMIDSNGDGRLDSDKGEVSPVYFKLYGW